jgi:hypothetical protein
LPGINIAFTSTGLEAVSHRCDSRSGIGQRLISELPIARSVCKRQRPRVGKKGQKAFSNLPEATTPWWAF